MTRRQLAMETASLNGTETFLNKMNRSLYRSNKRTSCGKFEFTTDRLNRMEKLSRYSRTVFLGMKVSKDISFLIKMRYFSQGRNFLCTRLLERNLDQGIFARRQFKNNS